uniref:Uncharacterized protein n=1 Tax=Oryza nivara TaxID=4536 RepID=A0A0E0IT10_ORYNI
MATPSPPPDPVGEEVLAATGVEAAATDDEGELLGSSSRLFFIRGTSKVSILNRHQNQHLFSLHISVAF